MEQFISIDWGTSSLRCRVVNAESNGIEAEVCSEMGIAYVFENWNSIGKPEQERLSFYQAILGEEIKKLEKNMSERLDGLAVIISGMASANIGMKNLPYKVLPFSISGGDLGVEFINSTKDFNHNTLLVSGVRSDNDVMRGEETQLIGSVTGSNDEELYIFPGTHSKHMTVRNGQVNEFKTYMTGEVFSLLSTKSILSKSIEKVMQLST
ncbi:MAG: 2-dehydro-3-deoxygalactonokinase, partial [Ginsengibacter sp.]